MRLKRMSGALAATLAPQCRFDRALFLFGHMRCGSTALANIICSRPDHSGYGEAHIDYGEGQVALGALVVNQWRRRAWRPGAAHLFDKILHSRYDADAAPGFFDARAVFLVRAPEATISSIRQLFASLGSSEYGTDRLAADYYRERMGTLQGLWHRFAPDRRAGLSYEALAAAPEAALAHLTAKLDFAPALANRYESKPASIAQGAGDPLASRKFDRIVARPDGQRTPPAIDLPAAALDELRALHRETLKLFTAS